MNGLADPMLQQQQPMMGMPQATTTAPSSSIDEQTAAKVAQTIDQNMASMPDTSSYSFATAVLTTADQFQLDEKGIVESLIYLAATAPTSPSQQPAMGGGQMPMQPNMMGLGGM